MSTPHLHDRTTASSSTTKARALTGTGVVLACAIACSLPLIAAGGLVAGVGAFLTGGGAVGLGVVLLLGAATGLALWLRRRHAAATRAGTTGCGCGGGCG